MKLIPKYQQGYGIVPVGYTALPWTTTAAGAASGAAPQAAKAKEDNLFSDTIINSLKSKALTSDMQYFLSQSSLFKDDIFSGMFDASTTEQRTKELLLYATRMENEKEEYSKATERIRNIKAQDEIALTPDGQVFVYNKGKVEVKRYANITNKDMLLTNAQLANYRANDVTFAFNNNVTNTLSNATSFKEIREVIDAAVQNLGQQGQDERNIYGTKSGGSEDFINAIQQMGITQKELQQIPADKLIEVKVKGMSNAQQIQHAFNAVLSQLTPTQQRLLGIRAKQLNVKDYSNLVLEYINARSKGSISYSMDIMNLKDGTKGSNRTSGEKDITDLTLTPGMEMGYELGRKVPVTINLGTKAQISALGTSRTITSKTGENIGQKLGTELLQSSIANNLQLDQITMGGVKIPEEQLVYTFIKNGTAVALNLPVDKKKEAQGIITPDVRLSQKVYDILKQHKNEKDPDKINKALQDAGLPIMYKGKDANGMPIVDTTNYQRFVAIDAIADAQAFGNSKPEEDLVLEVKDKPSAFESQLKKFNNKLDLSENWIDPNFYSGTIYLPFDMNVIGSYVGSGNDLTVGEALKLEGMQQKSDAISSGSVEQVYNNNKDTFNRFTNGDKK